MANKKDAAPPSTTAAAPEPTVTGLQLQALYQGMLKAEVRLGFPALAYPQIPTLTRHRRRTALAEGRG